MFYFHVYFIRNYLSSVVSVFILIYFIGFYYFIFITFHLSFFLFVMQIKTKSVSRLFLLFTFVLF